MQGNTLSIMTNQTRRASAAFEPKLSSGSTAQRSTHGAADPDILVVLFDHERRHLDGELASLTQRERDVVFAICAGGANEAVAERLAIALPTLRTHLMRVNQKLGTTGKADVVRFVLARLLDGYRAGRLQRSGAELTPAQTSSNQSRTAAGADPPLRVRPGSDRQTH